MASLDQTINFGKVEVSTGYAAGATSVALSAGEGAKLPDPSGDNYNLVWWDSTLYPDPADDPNVEIVRVTAKSTDTLTVTRAQEGTGDSAKNTGGSTYKMALALTKATMDILDAGMDKLDGIEASADVTDEANVKSALDGATITSVTVATDDDVLIHDTSDSDNLKKVTAQSIADLAGGGGATHADIFMLMGA